MEIFFIFVHANPDDIHPQGRAARAEESILYTLKYLNTGTSKNHYFPSTPNEKLMVYRHPNI